MSNPVGKIFQHIRTGNCYKVLNIGRNVRNPLQKCIIYEQLQESVLINPKTFIPVNPKIILPKGSIWIRKLSYCNKSKFKETTIEK
jgi:uncharacterized protein (UPF0179 family)